jgi:4-hydroxybenzoate polyprenyltransferase
MGLVRGIVRTMRPHQWVKNVFVLAPVVFAKELFQYELLLRAGAAFVVFCLLAGAVYTVNDILDVDADRLHPVKRFRPIASGVVPVATARVVAALLLAVAMAGAVLVSPLFAVVAAIYFVQNLAYSFKLKSIAYADVAFIALGFVLRVIAGGLATRIEVSGYLLACTALLALFLGFGKRAHELAGTSFAVSKRQRASLEAYTSGALGRALWITGAASIVTYIAYTIDPSTRRMFHSDLLWLTAPNPVFGVLRFVYLVRSRPKAESPTQEMLRDAPFMINLFIWVAIVVAIVYKLRPSAGL